ncbi:MAG: ATP-binding cassette domain-containing protein, partial [Pseudomonadota bacterium]
AGFDVLASRQEAQTALGYLPEGAPLYQHMTPLEFLHFIGQVRGLSGGDLKSSIERAMADIRIGHVARQLIGTLSKGYRRRVALAASILHDPEVLILDEPLDGLDPNQKRTVRAQIVRMAQTKAIVISTHTLEEVPLMCNRAVIIHKGRLVAEGSPDELHDAGGAGGLEAHFANLTDHGMTV